MEKNHWKTILLWGIILVGVLMVGAAIDAFGVSGTCMFILMPYFSALAVVYPMLVVRRFATGFLVYIPYALIGFFPLYYFDWLQSRALVGLWAVFAWSFSGPLTGLILDLVHKPLMNGKPRTQAIALGAAMQLLTFIVLVVGLTQLYTPASDMASHTYFFSKNYYFSLPWMVVNGAFGGYTAYAMQQKT